MTLFVLSCAILLLLTSAFATEIATLSSKTVTTLTARLSIRGDRACQTVHSTGLLANLAGEKRDVC